MAGSKPLILYDIISPGRFCSYAPNPSKARLALSFKNVPFKTAWIDILDIPKVRKELGCPATRKLDNGSDFHTLPMLRDPVSDKVIGDSFDISHYLEEKFPDSGGCLFPVNSTHTGLDYESPQKDLSFSVPITTNEQSKNVAYAKFNWHVDTTFTAFSGLAAQGLPFPPETAEAIKAMIAKRAHLNSWDDTRVEGEQRTQLKAAFKASLTSLAELFNVHESGPFLEGQQANYADLIVGGWLNMFSVCMPEEEWKDFRTWHDGIFARLHDALQENYFKSG